MSTPTNSADSVPAPGSVLPPWLIALLAVGVLLVLSGSGVAVYRWARGLASSVEVTAPPALSAEETGGDSAESDPINPSALSDPVVVEVGLESTPVPARSSGGTFQPWQGTERVTVLLLGNDLRCEEEGPNRTDSIMLVSFDPVARSASMLSLPRDLWVEIPGVGMDRINQAHYWGEYYEYPGGGAALAMLTVENLLGVPIDHYLTVNFDGFVQFIDLIGGIDIEIPETIDDPNYPDDCYGYAGFSVKAGWYEGFDGQATLKYARTRATPGGDVDRAQRQQAVILAVRDRVLRLNMLPQLIGRSPQLWQTLQNNVSTSLTDVEAIQLALLVQEVPRENIETAVIDYTGVIDKTTPDGRDVLVPLREKLRALRLQLFAPVSAPTPVVADLLEKMQAEGARVAVYNGTPVFGLAGRTQTYLVERGVDVTAIGNADAATYVTTLITDYGDHPHTLQYLTDLMQLPPLNADRSDATPPGDFDVLIILGNDWDVPAP